MMKYYLQNYSYFYPHIHLRNMENRKEKGKKEEKQNTELWRDEIQRMNEEYIKKKKE